MASIPGQPPQQVEQQQPQQQQQPPSQPKTFRLTPTTIQAIKEKIKAMGTPPFAVQEMQRKYDHLTSVLNRVVQLYNAGQIEVPLSLFQQPARDQQQIRPQIQQMQQPSIQVQQVQASTIQLSQPVVQQQHQPHQQQPIMTQSNLNHASMSMQQTNQTQMHAAQPSVSQPVVHQHQAASASHSQTLDKKTLQDLVKDVDPNEILDDEVEEILLQVADDFIENVINSSCQLAKHRKSNTLDAKDVQFHLERNFNIWIPGFATDELKAHKKALSSEAHKQRLQLIKKSAMKPNEPAASGLSSNSANKDK